MNNRFPDGVWPVMLTPFTSEREVDYKALEKLVNWYIDNGVNGLFAVCQSSEMFYLTLEERLEVAKCVLKAAAGRVPVIASGHVSDSMEDQIEEVNAMAETGVAAVILITNRLAKEDESDKVWRANCKTLLNGIKTDIPLGFYECPYPYKRLITVENIDWCAKTGRFYFLKDTCCDLRQIQEKLEAIKGTNLRLYNANTTTLLESLRSGAAGFSGVMANFHPKLYCWLCDHAEDEKADELAAFLSVASLIERQYYPVNAKYHLQTIEGLPIDMTCRVKEADGMTDTFEKEVRMLDCLAKLQEQKLGCL